jgi:hypothetical protein
MAATRLTIDRNIFQLLNIHHPTYAGCFWALEVALRI